MTEPEEPEDLTSAAPTDLTVELRNEHADPDAEDAVSVDSVGSTELEATVAPEDYWRPRTRLSTRLEPSRLAPASARSNRQWWIAALIVIGAVIVAAALWLAALWAQGRDDNPEPETEDAAAVIVDAATAAR